MTDNPTGNEAGNHYPAPPTLESVAIDVAGHPHVRDAKKNLVPLELVKAVDKLEDEMVRKVHGFAADLSAQVDRFRAHTFEDIGDFMGLLQQEYGAAKGGKKGNVSFRTFDGLLEIRVQVADVIEFGAELQVAKQIIDECLIEWSEGSRVEIRSIVQRAFNTDKEGQVNRAELFALRRLDIEDERWLRAMEALGDAIRVVGTREYVRIYERDTVDEAFRPVTINLAKAA